MLPKLLRTYKYNIDKYSEDFQTIKCRFAFAVKLKDGNYKAQHQFVRCRDFLNDTLVWKAKEAPEKTIYGYNFRGRIETTVSCLAMVRHGKLKERIGELNAIERKLGLRETEVIDVDFEKPERVDDGPAVIVIGDKWWQKTTVQYSWWTLMLRQLCSELSLLDAGLNMLPNLRKPITAIPAAMKEAPFVSVSGTKPEVRGNMHTYNGFMSQLGHWSKQFCTYGDYLYGKLCKA